MASAPFVYGGAWTSDACQKVVRFVDLAQTFQLPVAYLVDCPGFMIGLEAEKAATIRHGVRAMAAVNQATVPWCSVIVRNAFGVAGAMHQPAAKRREIDARLQRLRSPFCTAEAFRVEEIIDPRDTRRLLCEFAALAYPLLTPGPAALPIRP